MFNIINNYKVILSEEITEDMYSIKS